MGSSLIMSEYTTLSTYNRSKKGSPSWYGAAVPLALGTSAHACHMVQTYFKTQKPALGPPTSASWQGKEWEDTLAILPPFSRWEPGLERLGEGKEKPAIWLCITALFFLRDFLFPVITLDFRMLYLLQKPYLFPHNLGKGYLNGM